VASPEEERWIWVGFAKESRLLLCIVVGPKLQESADKLVEGIDSCLDKKKELPLFVSDGNNQYTVALFNMYSETVTPDRTGRRGRPEVLYKIPRMDLRYAQVIKERKGGKLVKVHKKIIFGDKEDISHSDITTSHIELQNLYLNKNVVRNYRASKHKNQSQNNRFHSENPIKTQTPAPPLAPNPTVPLCSRVKRTESAGTREVRSSPISAAAILNTGEPEGASV
jgi:hypothetical protein